MMLDKHLNYQLNIFAVMDCILDEYFKNLQVCLPSPVLRSFTNLMAIITRHCPDLEHLEVSFQDSVSSNLVLEIKRTSCLNKNELYTIPPNSPLLSLKSLTLNFKNAGCISCPVSSSLWSIVGKLCPVLTRLKVTGADLHRWDFVALIVNAEIAEILFPIDGWNPAWSENSVYNGIFQIPFQFLNPLCSTLKELILDPQEFYSYDSKFSVDSVFAFALRHLHMLEKIDVGTYHLLTILEAIKLLHQVFCKNSRNLNQTPFEVTWRHAASHLGLHVASPVTFFPGKYF